MEESISEKILLTIYEMDKNNKDGRKITKEDMVVKAWKMFPKEFCIKGYPQYPNADTSKYVTKLFKEGLLKGSFYNYIITEKGKEYARTLISNPTVKNKKFLSTPRQIEQEISRIRKSKVFQLYIKGESEFIESDLFDFLGTSSRSLTEANRTVFTSKFNLISKEIIPFCEKNKKQKPDLEKISLLWSVLLSKFGHLLNEGVKSKK